MKHSSISKLSGLSALIVTGILSAGVLAADPVPATAPVPGAVASAPMRSVPRVEIFAFTPVNKADPADWIGRGIQENLQSDVSRTGATLVLPPHAQAASTDEPMVAALHDHADLAVIGTYQVAGDQIRVNAHLMDVTSNTAVGGFSATASQHDLFKLEDALGEQLRSLLPRPMMADQLAQASPAAQAAPQQVPTVVYQEAPSTYYAPSTANYYASTPNYYPDYGYGYGYYGYPYGFYGGVIYSSGFYNRGFICRPGPVFRSGVNVGFRGSVGAIHVGVGGARGGGGGGRR